MGNCFTKTVTHEIVEITWGTIDRPPSSPGCPAGRPPPPANLLPACWVVWPALQRPVLDVRSLYILERELWTGRFGTTYLCTERATGQRFVCRSVSKLRPAEVEYMRREVTVLQRLGGHPNVAGFRAAFEDADSLYLVAELCSGGGLFDRVIARGSYSERQAAAACRDVLTVVRVCHSMGVMHRDISLENFLLASLAEDTPLKAIGFGLSVFIEQGKVYKENVGSAYYVAPEVLHRNYGREADVWSAGVILYILLCGSAPFWAETEKGVFDAILVGQVDFCSSPWPTISESAKDLIRQMLNRDPQKRITAVQALEHPWLKEGGASDRPIGTKQFEAMSKLKPPFRKASADNLSPEDTNKSKKITGEELKIGLTSEGSEAEDRKLTKAADVDKSGSIHNKELPTATMNKHKPEKEEDLLPAVQRFDEDNNGHRANGEKDARRVNKGSKSSGQKNDKKEEEQEFNKPENDSLVMEEVPLSQDELEKKLEDNNMKEMGVDKGLVNKVREVNSNDYQEKNHVEIEDGTDDKHAQHIQEMNKDRLINTNESADGTSASGKDREDVNNTQGTTWTEKENFVDEERRTGVRTDMGQKIMDKAVERIESKNLETGPGDKVSINNVEIEDITDDKDATHIQETNKDRVIDTNDSTGGISTGGEDSQEVNSTQGTTGTDKENFVDEEMMTGGRTGMGQNMDDQVVERIEAKNLETVPGDKVGINHFKIADITDDKHTQHIHETNKDRVIDINESAVGISTGEKDGEEVNNTQGAIGTDKENFLDEERRTGGRPRASQKMTDGQVVEEIEAKNLETVPGDKVSVSHMEIEDITNDKHTQHIQETNTFRVINTNESTYGISTSGKDKEDVNSTQETIRTNNENFVDEEWSTCGRTGTR